MNRFMLGVYRNGGCTREQLISALVEGYTLRCGITVTNFDSNLANMIISNTDITVEEISRHYPRDSEVQMWVNEVSSQV